MSDIYVMQRANGDLFALDDHGRFRVPLFRTSGEAMIARSRNFEMLLFKPVALNASLIQELGPTSDGTDVDLCLVKDPLRDLKHGRLVAHAQLAWLMESPVDVVPDNGKTFDAPVLSTFPQSGGSSIDNWEAEEGKQAQCA